MSGVIGRFYVDELTRRGYNPGIGHVKLRASTKGEQNKTWAAATPSGEISMAISNESALEWFAAHLGNDVEIRFAEIPAE